MRLLWASKAVNAKGGHTKGPRVGDVMVVGNTEFIEVSLELDRKGLIWQPEIGDEISLRDRLDQVSVLIDPMGMSPGQLRQTYVWLPHLEQLVQQFEARQSLLFHAGITREFVYEVVVKTPFGVVEAAARTLRLACAEALQEILIGCTDQAIH